MKSRLLILLGCMLIAMEMIAESTKTVSVKFSDFPNGVQYAENEQHDLGDGLVIYTTLCHFTEQLRIYASSTYNGYVISDPLPGTIISMSFKMGHKKDVLDVYGSTDKENWTLIKKDGIKTTSTSYKNYTLDFPTDANYTCFKLDVRGSEQIRIESLSITYVSSDNDESNDDEDDVFTVSAPVFIPGTSTFSTESLNVTITATEGCDIFYTTDGTTPSYANIEECRKGSVATIYASSTPVTLKAIAKEPITGEYSDVSSATYTYVDLSMGNDGSKTKPYTVEEVKALIGLKSNKWVKGIIYGTMLGYDINDGIATSDFSADWNIVLGNEETHIPVRLTNSGNIKSEINLKDHPYLKGKEILIKGELNDYCSSYGVYAPAEYKITYDVPINSYGYASLFLDMPVSVPTGSTAYYCTIEENYVNLCPVGNIVPAGVGIIIESEPNSTCTLTYTTEMNVNAESILNDNQLVGFNKDSVIAVDGHAYYALNVKDNKLGFYIPQTATDATDAAGGFAAIANKAYLKVDAEQKATMFLIRRGNDETTILPIVHVSDDIIYDLQGRMVSSPASGLYIRGGKKIIVR